MIDLPTTLWLVFGVGAVAAGAILRAKSTPVRSRLATAAAAVHPLLVVVLFYSLALHMHRRLGAWPDSLGDRGFPAGLGLHADLALGAFGALILGCLVAMPLALLTCAVVPKLRSNLRLVGIYGCASLLAVGLMQLAPDPFLYWWWD